jgi:hypothetical protein
MDFDVNHHRGEGPTTRNIYSVTVVCFEIKFHDSTVNNERLHRVSTKCLNC